MSESCIFCRIVGGEIPARFAHQDDEVVAFHDVDPQAPLHLLIIPKRHVPSIAATTADDAALVARLFDVATSIGRQLNLQGSGYRLVINHGADGGQSVGHLHVHLLGGRQLGWPPG